MASVPRSRLYYFVDKDMHFRVTVMLGFGANNKKIMCYATPNMPKDLSISNVVTVGVRTHILGDRNAGITLPHKR
jgi:hypothetical protein